MTRRTPSSCLSGGELAAPKPASARAAWSSSTLISSKSSIFCPVFWSSPLARSWMRRDFPRKSRGAFGVSGLRIACLETARPEVKSCEAGGWEEEKKRRAPLHATSPEPSRENYLCLGNWTSSSITGRACFVHERVVKKHERTREGGSGRRDGRAR